MSPDDRRPTQAPTRRFPPVWVYLFGLFAVAISQRALFPPEEHSIAFNVTVFVAMGAAVVVVLTLLQRFTR